MRPKAERLPCAKGIPNGIPMARSPEKNLLSGIEELTRVNDQAEEHTKKMEAGKAEKREQVFRLQTQQKDRLPPER
ncbi:hypothetical protein NDU88_005717 [Pleurodeles waltl]|uniref:Uncharacterized protein n=1 Tax=Pleurodeles waltl TaxID=8319 RepID=A0AAV7TVM5_PLEWA|nr:hypothetical protein NDU88_005717 [Pleurodeles waltl]